MQKEKDKPNNDATNQLRFEKEWNGPTWRHPYVIYIILTIALFATLVTVALIMKSAGWVPTR